MKNFLGVVGGVVIGGILLGFITTYSHGIYGASQEISHYDQDSMREFIQSLPAAAFIWLVVANSLGAFVAGAFAGRLSQDNHFYLGIVAAGVIFLLGLVNFFTIPGIPSWYMFAQSICVIALGIIGAKIGSYSHQQPGDKNIKRPIS